MAARRLPQSWLAILATFHHTPIFGRVWLVVALLAAYAAAAVAVDHSLSGRLTKVQADLHALLGLVLGLLLVFRTNTAYDRWWEGRKLWGALVNESRNLAIKIAACVQAPPEEKRLTLRRLASFAVALKEHLRQGTTLARLEGFEEDAAQPQHVPAYVSRVLYEQIERWKRAEQLGGFELLFLDRHAAALMDICGACERIRNTPISASWRWFIRQAIALYLLSLPWGLLEDFGWWTIAAVVLVGYFMVGIEMIAEAVEEPFGLDADDLELDALCETIGGSICEIQQSALA